MYVSIASFDFCNTAKPERSQKPSKKFENIFDKVKLFEILGLDLRVILLKIIFMKSWLSYGTVDIWKQKKIDTDGRKYNIFLAQMRS